MSNTISTLEVKVQMRGFAVGTQGWFREMIDDSELVIRKTREGIPGMFLHEKHNRKGEERKEHEGNSFICSPASGNQQDEGFNLKKINGIEYIYVQTSGNAESTYIFGEDVCLTDRPITPSCRVCIEEFIQKAIEEFAAWYEVQ